LSSKYDGFRALAYVDAGSCRLVSRRNHIYRAYAPLCEWIGKHLGADDAVLDGELACLDEEGKPRMRSGSLPGAVRPPRRAVCL
jgi:bifunctional non-homologous end joining protein LigD